jgi:hypothetical protein
MPAAVSALKNTRQPRHNYVKDLAPKQLMS